jgi:hypothetical protein
MTRRAKVKASTVAKISINFPKDLWKDLKRRALEDGENMTDILVRSAREYLAKAAAKKPSRQKSAIIENRADDEPLTAARAHTAQNISYRLFC